MSVQPIVVLGGSGRLGRRYRALVGADRGQRVINVDPREPAPFPTDLDRFALVVLAAKITLEVGGEGFAAVEELLDTNALTPVRFAAAHAERVTRVVFASSLEIYGDAPDATPLREDAPPRPTTAYGISKLLGERAMRLYCDNRSIPCVTLRFASLYGAEDDLSNALVGFLDRAARGLTIDLHGDGSGTRSYLHLDDAAGVLSAALQYPSSDVFNAASPEPITLRQLAETAVAAAGDGRVAWTQPGAPAAHRALDGTKLRLLPYAPLINIADGMRRLLALRQQLGDHERPPARN